MHLFPSRIVSLRIGERFAAVRCVGAANGKSNMYHYRETPPDGQGMTIGFRRVTARTRCGCSACCSAKMFAPGPRRSLICCRSSKQFCRIERASNVMIFSRSMFGEPGWELLLALYAADAGLRPTIGKLAQLAELPTTTALRWLSYLEDQRLIVREEHPTDARTAFVELTDKARECFQVYLSDTLTPRL